MNTLAIKFLKYFEIAKVTYYDNTAYIGDVLGIGGLIAARVWIFSQLYSLAFRLDGSAEIGGITLAQTIWILALTQSFHISNRTRRIMKNIEYDVKSGNIAHSITKPYSYLWFNFFACFGVIGSHLLLTTFFSSLTALLIVGLVKFSLIGTILGIILLFFGFVMNILVILILGLLAFWTEDTSAYRWIYDKFLWIFGGIFLPISLFPEKFKTIVELLPFNQMFYAPAKIMIVHDLSLFSKYLLLQIIWIAIFATILTVVYRKGIREVSINAG